MSDICVITVGHDIADFTGNTNSVIQAAVDQAASYGGGIVKILPGRYIMKDSLHLRTNVTIEGSGQDTVLWKCPSVSSLLTYYLGYGHYDVSVTEPDKFEIGTGLRITDDESSGFYNTVATVTDKQGSELILNRMLNHDYRPYKNGRIVSVYPVISGYFLENASICNLTIDGNSLENEYIDGCRGGGIFLLQAHNVQIRKVTVKNYNGDAISFQQCKNTLIEDSCCMDNTGIGIHPGSGSVGAIMRNVVSKNNGEEGIFYCLRVSYTLCEGCNFEGNKRAGISIGHRDTDAIIRNNIISGNGYHGIYFRPDELNKSGCRTQISGNSFNDNCRLGGEGEIFFDTAAESVMIYNNKGVGKDQVKASQAIYLNGVSFEKPEKDMPIGPEFADEKAVYHLGVWKNV